MVRRQPEKITRAALPRLRLIPLTMVMAMLMLGVKVDGVVRGGQDLSQALRFSEATAAQEAFAEETNDKVEEAAAEDTPQESEDSAHADKEGGEGEDKPESAEEGGGPEKISVSDTADAPEHVEVEEKRHFTQIEIDLLQSLSERREQIDSWEKELDMRANILKATEQRIDDKISEMQGLKGEVEALLSQYNDQEDTKIRSLVKIYENMKPKDAARIFEEVEMPILLLVVDRMAEKKVAPILAKMSATKAKEVTMQLAEQRRLQRNVTDSMQALQQGMQ